MDASQQQQQQMEKAVLGSRVTAVATASFLVALVISVFNTVSTNNAIGNIPNRYETFRSRCASGEISAEICKAVFDSLMEYCRRNKLQQQQCIESFEGHVARIKAAVTSMLLGGLVIGMCMNACVPCCGIMGAKNDNRGLVIAFMIFNSISLLLVFLQLLNGHLVALLGLPLPSLAIFLSFKLQQAQAAPPVVAQPTMVQAPVVSSYPQPVAQA
mmetsp:Transcript_111955/g.316711  ORF Transcript_111955/g.316711 Transcript_111955/m.316711 type:complete len:214 (-) Transcript_111955:147-788(-)